MEIYCNAFDDDHNPCLNQVSWARGICGEHSEFYEPTKWFKHYINGDPNLIYSEHSTSKVRAIHKKAILDKYIIITQPYLKQLEQIPTILTLEFYILCCRQEGVDPMWSNKLYVHAIEKIVHCHSAAVYPLIKENRHFLDTFVVPLLNNTTRQIDSVIYTMLYTIASCVVKVSIDPSALYIDNPEVSVLQIIQDHPRFKNEFLWIHSEMEDKLRDILSSTKHYPLHTKLLAFLDTLPEKRKVARESRKVSFSETAQEIVEVAWNPTRSMEWYLDINELGEIKKRWYS